MRKFKTGDIVQLSKDAPKMKVKDFEIKDLVLGYNCQWFDGKGKLQEGFFPEESLIKVEEEKD